jgi:PAS domain S-box-containing protein
MKKNRSENTLKNFVIFGILFSILFLIAIFVIALISNDYLINFYNLRKIHREIKILWIIDLAPILFILATYWLGQYFSKTLAEYEQNIDNEVQRSKQTFNFIEDLRQGITDAKLENIDERDELGLSLINLRNELKRSKEEEETRKREDEQRNWVSEGLAKFGAILRENIDNLELLSSEVTSNLVKYIDAKQAAFFILEENGNEKFFNMTAHFAYGRKKFPDKKLQWGEGLIGACALEKKTIFIKEVTETFVEVTSGLGKANPRCILLVPLKNNEDIHGVLEIASFKIYEPYEINFVEMIAESIASTISNVKINMRTKDLLNESQKQAEIMAKQEDEMRKNMEELKVTQIEAAKQSEQFISFTNSVNHTLIRAEYSIDGKLLYSNTKFLNKLGYASSSEVDGKHISMFVGEKDKQWFDELWENLAKGGRHFEGDMKHITKDGNDIWTMATYVSVRDHEGKPQKILFLGIDITEDKKINLDYKGQIDALNRSTLKAEYNSDGTIIEYNQKMLESIGYTFEEIKGKTIFDFINEENIDEFRVIWKNILSGIPHESKQQRVTKEGESKWFRGTYTIVHDMYGDPAKVVYIASDITEQTKIENKNKEQTEILKEQESKLQEAKLDLSKKLDQAREEMKLQFREIETVKMLNDKTLEGMLDAIVSINQDNIVTFFNKAAEDLWKVKQDEVLGKSVDYLLSENEDTKQENFMGRYFRAGENILVGKRTEVFILDKTNGKISVLLTLSEARIGTRYSLTAFIQRIEVELF